MSKREAFQAVLDILALAQSLEPKSWKVVRRILPEGADFSYTWVDPDLAVEDCECPLTHAARVLLGYSCSVATYQGAAQVLGIPQEVAEDFTFVADSTWAKTPRRQALLDIYDLPELPC